LQWSVPVIVAAALLQTAHAQTAHSDGTTHSDATTHSDNGQTHTDSPHSDQSLGSGSHVDAAHSDNVQTHTDTPHFDVSNFADQPGMVFEHTDSPHGDDQSHSDTNPHSDASPHTDAV
jgi:hypothetical protein